ncbi:hypothetical protein [Umezawaea sp. Da 62-37]|uniref:hypothetical protein n=1 Tax=Umezawaea sp. Da 62-37 TaxID=3075927 RepID=UPI0028F6F53E|nr:hypothetical protein [Umezawaea sp. Da 62-37]WNV83189.1 hypothetical protein RM788_34080 [Umezawaea sp. Da 62-37]
MVDEVEIRKRLTKHLRGAVTEREWDFLLKRRVVGELLEADDDGLQEELDDCISLIKNMRAVYPDVEPVGSTAPEETLAPVSASSRSADVGARSTAYALALSENVAAEADHDRQIAEFRKEFLAAGLIQLDQVEDWIAEHTDRDEDVRQAQVLLPPGWEFGQPLPGAVNRVFVDQLAYVAPGFSHVRMVVVAPGTVLGRLRRLATGLAVSHGWEPGQAATWVLTGVTPLIGLIRVTEGAENIREQRWTAWSERITLDVHPAVAPEEVADAYRAARARFDNHRTDGNYRARSQLVPQLVLARFVARPRAQGVPWETLRKQWNSWILVQSEHSGLKRFDFESTFRRAGLLACKRVLYRGLFAGRGATAAALANDQDDQ